MNKLRDTTDTGSKICIRGDVLKERGLVTTLSQIPAFTTFMGRLLWPFKMLANA